MGGFFAGVPGVDPLVISSADKRQGGNTPKPNQPKPQMPKIKVKGGRFGTSGAKQGK